MTPAEPFMENNLDMPLNRDTCEKSTRDTLVRRRRGNTKCRTGSGADGGGALPAPGVPFKGKNSGREEGEVVCGTVLLPARQLGPSWVAALASGTTEVSPARSPREGFKNVFEFESVPLLAMIQTIKLHLQFCQLKISFVVNDGFSDVHGS